MKLEAELIFKPLEFERFKPVEFDGAGTVVSHGRKGGNRVSI